MDELHLLLIKLTIMSKIEDDPGKRMVFDEAAKVIQQLFDENQSLWNMLDEIKASDIAAHNEHFESALTTISSLLSGRGDGDA